MIFIFSGGTVIFDRKDIELRAESILITDGGTLQVSLDSMLGGGGILLQKHPQENKTFSLITG